MRVPDRWTRSVTAGRTGDRFVAMIFTCFFMLSAASPAFSADDDYLKDLDAEVLKVEARRIDGESGSSEVEAPAESPAVVETPSDISRSDFDEMLKKRFRGADVLYQRLSERSRQEVFQKYLNGASMRKIRQTIYDRLLNR